MYKCMSCFIHTQISLDQMDIFIHTYLCFNFQIEMEKLKGILIRIFLNFNMKNNEEDIYPSKFWILNQRMNYLDNQKHNSMINYLRKQMLQLDMSLRIYQLMNQHKYASQMGMMLHIFQSCYQHKFLKGMLLCMSYHYYQQKIYQVVMDIDLHIFELNYQQINQGSTGIELRIVAKQNLQNYLKDIFIHKFQKYFKPIILDKLLGIQKHISQ